jgi:hypothetical protein
MKKALAILVLIPTVVALLGGSAGAAVSVTAKYQLRGHLPELGEVPTMRYFLNSLAYEKFRTDLGDANVFPPASSLFMSFDKEMLALYTRGNDTGGRCIGTQIAAGFSGDTLTATATWQAGTCGAPSAAHYPFILFSLSRTATDGSSWLSSARMLCLSVETQDTNACVGLGGAPAPSATASPAPTSSATSAPSATAAPTATRSLTPTQTVAAASPTVAPTSAAPSATRSPAAAASPPAAASDNGSNILLYAMLVAIGFLVLLSLFLSRGGRRR